MGKQDEGKDAKGRSHEQITKGGSSSAASLGAGATGDAGRQAGESGAGNAQSARTDDLMAPDGQREQGQGFRASDPGVLKTGMEGIVESGKGGNSGGGNRQ